MKNCSRSSDAGEKGNKESRQLGVGANSSASSSGAGFNNNNNDEKKSGRDSPSANLNCVQCNKTLPKPGGGGLLSLSQPVQCSICSLRVCKDCAVWNPARNTLTCGHCHPPT